MSSKPENQNKTDHIDHEALYEDADYWHVNTGEETIHAKRMPGRFRTLKWWSASIWLIFFLGPYLRWDGHQAILFDIANRKFHIFDITILPQDVWLLAVVMLFFAMLLGAVTSVAGRVFCGYFCFQTVWTDIFTLLEEKLEGSPAQRARLDKAPWNARKIRIKVIKHFLWILIGLLTGISFTLWFADAYQMWESYLTLTAPLVAWVTVATFTVFTYIFAGFMREQVCLWLCPYCRIQGVMYDCETILPTYDVKRGEPRGKLKKNTDPQGRELGDCIDCKLCVAVCPTGVDIRHGQQEGCITCGLCLDACDSIMDKIHRPRGLISYISLDEINGKPKLKLFQRPRVLGFLAILVVSVAGMLWGVTHLGSLELSVIHERQPLYVIQSDGSIQNKYELKVLNKTDKPMDVDLTVTGTPYTPTIHGATMPWKVAPGDVGAFTVFLRIPGSEFKQERTTVVFTVSDVEDENVKAVYESMFFGPGH